MGKHSLTGMTIMIIVLALSGPAIAQVSWAYTTWGNSNISQTYQGNGSVKPFLGAVDLNGDGLTDLPSAISTGSNFVASSALPSLTCFNGNFDGSGRTSSVCVNAQSANKPYINELTYAKPLGTSYATEQTEVFSTNLPVGWQIDISVGKLVQNVYGCFVGDVNGDGRDDLVCPLMPFSTDAYNSTITQFAVYLAVGDMSTASAFTYQIWSVPLVFGPEGLSLYGWTLAVGCMTGDFNGDGLMDIACPASSSAWNVLLSSGSGFIKQAWAFPGWVQNVANVYSNGVLQLGKCLTGDFDGDGVIDIACGYFSTPTIQGNTWVIAFGGGISGFKTIGTWAGISDAPYQQSPINTGVPAPKCIASDALGAGRMGIICWALDGSSSNPTKWEYLSSSGASFSAQSFNTPSAWNLGYNFGGGVVLFDNCIFGDFNGDGLVDVACPNLGTGGGFNMGLSSRPQ